MTYVQIQMISDFAEQFGVRDHWELEHRFTVIDLFGHEYVLYFYMPTS